MKKVLLAFFLLTGVASAQQLDSINRADLAIAGSRSIADSAGYLRRGIFPVTGIVDSVGWMGHNNSDGNDSAKAMVYANSANLPTTLIDTGTTYTVISWTSAALSKQTLAVRATFNAGDTVWFGVFCVNRSGNSIMRVSHGGGSTTRTALAGTLYAYPPSTISYIGYSSLEEGQVVLYYHTPSGGEGTLVLGGADYGG